MNRILVFGATGHAGRAIVQAFLNRQFNVTAVVRNAEKARRLFPETTHLLEAQVTEPDTLRGICQGYDVVVSALGKSVSPNDWSRPSFEAVDYQGNLHILREAQAARVQQFIYISAFQAENMRYLTYFRVHDDFSKALINSGLNYTVVQPPAIMSAFLDLAVMARKGWLVTFGKGDCLTNPISEQDLAQVCADAIGKSNQIIAAGGKKAYTRHQINEIIQQQIAPGRKVRRLPLALLGSILPVWKILNRNMYDKLAFFHIVIQHELLAPPVGETSLESYLAANISTNP